MVKELQRLQKVKQAEMSKISLLTDEDLETMFYMLDPIKVGTLSAEQVKKALKNVGLRPAQDILNDEVLLLFTFML
jgi:hypothetical protein